jgi:Carboxypeptidase regulatory-like domain
MSILSLRRVSILLVSAAGIALAQSITGSITGTIRDPGGLAITGAAIKLVQQGTGAVRQSLTGDRGNFVIGSLPPGAYDLFVSASGFKRYEMKSVMLSASEIQAVPEIVVEIGAVAE